MSLSPLPDIFLERLHQIIPESMIADTLASFTHEKPTTFRVNPLKATPAELEAELTDQGFKLEPVDWYPGAWIINNDQRRALTEADAFYSGQLYIQNLSSMVAPMVLAPQPEETVLDLAAAPGGKTLQIAAMMNNQGRLSAVEPVKGRFFKLRANLEQQGATVVKTYMTDGRSVGSKCPEMFDRVLLDAPCSSEARFSCLDSSSWSHWNLQKVKETARKQKRLLQSALHSLKPGGSMVYCTCSYSPEENELIVNAQLKKFGDAISIEPVELPFTNVLQGLTEWGKKTLAPQITHCRRILPTAVMDGFFLAKIHKHKSF